MLCEDSNGLSEIIAVCLLVQEDVKSMTWMVKSFKKLNPQWRKIRIIVGDKDMGERDVLKQCISNASACSYLSFPHLKKLQKGSDM